MDGKQPEARHIEVKGRVAGASTVTITRNEMLYALNQADKFLLAIVLVGESDTVDGPHYLRNPFESEPGWGVSSVNYDPRLRRTRELPVKSPRKLIEVALPLDAINAAAKGREGRRPAVPSSDASRQ